MDHPVGFNDAEADSKVDQRVQEECEWGEDDQGLDDWKWAERCDGWIAGKRVAERRPW